MARDATLGVRMGLRGQGTSCPGLLQGEGREEGLGWGAVPLSQTHP